MDELMTPLDRELLAHANQVRERLDAVTPRDEVAQMERAVEMWCDGLRSNLADLPDMVLGRVLLHVGCRICHNLQHREEESEADLHFNNGMAHAAIELILTAKELLRLEWDEVPRPES